MASATLSLTLDARFALWGIRLAGFLAPLIGVRAAVWLANVSLGRLRYRIDGGRWRPLTGIRVHVTREGEE